MGVLLTILRAKASPNLWACHQCRCHTSVWVVHFAPYHAHCQAADRVHRRPSVGMVADMGGEACWWLPVVLEHEHDLSGCGHGAGYRNLRFQHCSRLFLWICLSGRRLLFGGALVLPPLCQGRWCCTLQPGVCGTRKPREKNACQRCAENAHEASDLLLYGNSICLLHVVANRVPICLDPCFHRSLAGQQRPCHADIVSDTHHRLCLGLCIWQWLEVQHPTGNSFNS
mmetsp:Transcript_91947/g.173183  ORF Transcript_91947/g.173183 Transcript_91947/m.173183 type:complete len:227 (+) Transcript_91947:223-903(+)